ncbi:hypothetical protein [Sorangium sp. So ce388]|uniref:hypothetical protein n=1 Tax=Sorangium sp. So ce388 TaxID=3133309 RepID=UPI003F5B3660
MQLGDSGHVALLRALSQSWKGSWALSFDGDTPVPARHPLAEQIAAFLDGSAASLPYFGAREVVWVTLAPGAEALQGAIEALRAWIVPTYAWEDRMVSDAAEGPLSGRLLALSPAGYFRWRSRVDEAGMIASKLRAMARLDAARPRHVHAFTPSLHELRQRFATALVSGDHDTALDIVRTIDHHALDSAANTRFMRVQLWDRFREYGFVDDEVFVRDLVRLRLPQAVRMSLIRALHARMLAPLENGDDLIGAAGAYVARVHPLAGGLLDFVAPTDGLEARRCLGYRAWLLRDRWQAAVAVAGGDDAQLAALLTPLTSPEPTAPSAAQPAEVASPASVNVATVIGWTTKVIPELTDALPHSSRAALIPSIRRLLGERTDPDVAALLDKLEGASAKERVVPRDWSEFLDAWMAGRCSSAMRFLEWPARPSASELPTERLHALLDSIEESLTDPMNRGDDPLTGEIAPTALFRILDDLRLDPLFPRREHVRVHQHLLDLWVMYRGGSARREDAALFLLLADALLQVNPDAGADMVDRVAAWWRRRPNLSLLSFLLDALSLVSYYALESSLSAELWFEGAGWIKLDPSAVSASEVRAFRTIGQRLRIPLEEIDACIGRDLRDTGALYDVLARASLSKVAIVTRRERQADEAARQIRRRTRAQVIVVTDDAAGSATSSARLADVILIVWSTISHAVYRAFDGVREKLAYVQGTGAESIVAALEKAVEGRGPKEEATT